MTVPVTASEPATGAPPLIQIRAVHKSYGRKRVLNNISLSVAAGSVTALMGANGAGKSTLMRIVAGLAKADRGEVTLGGASLKKAGHELRRYIGLVAHAPLLYDQLSAEENLRFFASLYDLVDPGPRIETVLRSVELWSRRRDAVRTYSRGMTQRLAIARAILHDPPVLLLDEPDTGLDPASADLLAELIRTLGTANRAVLLTTHHVERALAWADRICLLRAGSIDFEQPAAALTAVELRALYGDGREGA